MSQQALGFHRLSPEKSDRMRRTIMQRDTTVDSLPPNLLAMFSAAPPQTFSSAPPRSSQGADRVVEMPLDSRTARPAAQSDYAEALRCVADQLRRLVQVVQQVADGQYSAVVVANSDLPKLNLDGSAHGDEVFAKGSRLRVFSPMTSIGDYVCMQRREIQATGVPRVVFVPLYLRQSPLVDFVEEVC